MLSGHWLILKESSLGLPCTSHHIWRNTVSKVQMFKLMVHFLNHISLHLGDLYFEKAVNGFLADLFAKWKVNKTRERQIVQGFGCASNVKADFKIGMDNGWRMWGLWFPVIDLWCLEEALKDQGRWIYSGLGTVSITKRGLVHYSWPSYEGRGCLIASGAGSGQRSTGDLDCGFTNLPVPDTSIHETMTWSIFETKTYLCTEDTFHWRVELQSC